MIQTTTRFSEAPTEFLELAPTEQVVEEKDNLLGSLLAQVRLPMPRAIPTVETYFQAGAVGEQYQSMMVAAALRTFIAAISALESPVGQLNKNLLDYMMAEIDTKLQAQLDEILHHPKFQQLEAAWRGLWFLVDRPKFRPNVQIEIIDISKDDLLLSFEDAPELTQSGLYKKVYTLAYDTPGADPYSAMIANYEFENTPQDLTLLQEVSKVAAASHCPFIGAVGPKFFGKNSMEEWNQISDLNSWMSTIDYMKWRSLRSQDDSRYLGLVLPRFLLRPPYGAATDSEVTLGFHYVENVKGLTADKYLWGNAVFPFATNLVSAYVEDGWCVQIRGQESGGKVDKLPAHAYSATRAQKILTEVPIDEIMESTCSNLGFIPFVHLQGQDGACFFSANSVQSPAVYEDNAQATANSKINARLPYIFLASRIAHYLKVLQRENIGTTKDKIVIEKELNTWINRLVNKMKTPNRDQIAKTPLSDARVQVHDPEDERVGFYQVDITIKPHFQIEGMDIYLSLVGKMPKAR